MAIDLVLGELNAYTVESSASFWRYILIGHTEVQILWFDLAISPVEIGDAFDQPAFLCHLGKVVFKAGMVIEGDILHAAFLDTHYVSSFPKMRR